MGRMGKKSSNIWNYFTVIDGERCTASCNICEKRFSFRTTITNLKKHLTRANHSFHLNLDSPETAVEFIELDGLPDEVNSAEEEGPANRCQLVIEEGIIPQNQNQADDILDISNNTFNTLQTNNIGPDQHKDLGTDVNLDLRQAFQNGIEGIADITDANLNGKHLETAKSIPATTQKESSKTSSKFLRPRGADASRDSRFGSNVSSSLGTQDQITSKFAADSSSDNEFELFGRHVANQLRKLSKVNSFLAQDEIQSILTRYRIYESMSQNSRRNILNSDK